MRVKLSQRHTPISCPVPSTLCEARGRGHTRAPRLGVQSPGTNLDVLPWPGGSAGLLVVG